MAPSRGKGKMRAARNATASSGRATRSTKRTEKEVPSVYQDLLAEASVTESADENTDRPLKKRKVVAKVSTTRQNGSASDGTAAREGEKSSDLPTANTRQTVEDSSKSDEEDDDESDVAFEDVDLDQPKIAPAEQDENEIQDVSISVDAAASTPKRRATINRSKPISAFEKAFRVLVHKAHILCLLGHCMYINGRCNNGVVQRHLRSKLSKKTISYLNHKTNDSQFQRNRSFMDGLQQASEAFRGMFSITTSGMHRARWPVEGDDSRQQSDAEPIDLAEFIQAAEDMEGSQDTANQLFCALLRSVGVDARLVCSLQVLPFTNVTSKSSTPQHYGKATIYAMAPTTDSAASDSNIEDASMQGSGTVGKVPSVRRRLGQPTFAAESTPLTPQKKKKPTRKLSYPIFWVEAFNTAQQKWIPVDPIVTQTIGRPSKVEPPTSYEWNHLTYAIAFEPSGHARDVTKRYTRAYNAKTRRHRIESTDSGAVWLKKALRIFRRRGRPLDREQLEDAELAQREAREGLPGNVQDFKDHPYYALERHLKRHEVIYPKREVGKVNAGTAAKPRMEVVFRREDVCVVRSAEKWFRLGREIRQGEVGVKKVRASRGRRERIGSEDEVEEEGDSMTALYALFQTELYVPPPVVKGKVPRNGFGNLDIYVPSMVPAGGVHVKHPLAKEAARILRVDCADAVTGFQFKGRHGTAVIEGAVIPEQYADAVRAVIDGLEDEQVEEESKARSAIALRMWRRLLTGLRIAERVSGYGDSKDENDIRDEMNQREDEQDTDFEAGGFFPDEGADDVAMPTAGQFSLDELNVPTKKSAAARTKKRKPEEDSEVEAEFESGDEDEVEFEHTNPSARKKRHIVDDESEDEYMPDASSPLPDEDGEGAGGFLPEDAEGIDGGGGFLVEDNVNTGDGGGGDISNHDIEMENPDGAGAGGFLSESDGEASGSKGSPEISTATGIEHGTNLPEGQMDNGFTMQQTLVTDAENSSGKDAALTHKVANHSPRFDHDTNGEISAQVMIPDLSSPGEIVQASSTDNITSESLQNDQANNALEEESDRGSMISHDSDDEDAEPDWLESD